MQTLSHIGEFGNLGGSGEAFDVGDDIGGLLDPAARSRLVAICAIRAEDLFEAKFVKLLVEMLLPEGAGQRVPVQCQP